MAEPKNASVPGKPGAAYFVDALGNPRTVTDPAEIERLSKEGRQALSPQVAGQLESQRLDAESVDQRYGTVGQGAMGVASGLTLGLGPQAWAGLTGDEQLKRDLRAMDGSGAFIGGEGLGMLLPALLSGGESLAARGAALTPAGVMAGAGGAAERLALGLLPETTGVLGKAGGQIVSMAARGATEGALMNLGHHVGQNIIYNRPLTSEALAAAGDGALFGGLMGGGMGALGGALGSVSEAIGSKALGGAGKLGGKGQRAEGAVLRELGATGEEDLNVLKTAGGLREEIPMKDVLKGLSEIQTAAGETIPGTIGKGTGELNRVVKDMVSEAKANRADFTSMLDREAPNLIPNENRVMQRIHNEVVYPKVGTMNLDRVQKVAEKVAEDFSNVWTNMRPEVGTWTKYAESTDQLRKSVDDYLRKAFDPNTDRELIKSVKAGILNVVDDEFRQAAQTAAKTIGKEGAAEAYNSAVVAQRLAEHIEEMTGSKLAKEALTAKPLLSPQDLAIAFGSASFGHPIFAAGMLAAKASTKIIEQRLTPKLAEMAYQVAIGNKAAAATVNVKGRISGAVKNFFKAGKGGANLANAKGYDRTIRNREEYDNLVDRAHELTSPIHQARVQAYARQLEAAGQVDLAMQTQLMNARAVQYIQNNMPVSTKAKGAGKLGPMPKFKGMDLKDFKFMRQLSAIDNPMGVIDKMASGEVSRDEVKALKYVYPEVHAELVGQTAVAIQEMKANGEFLPADKIATLGVVLDAPVDSTLEPEFIASVQATFVPPQAPQPQAAPPDPGVIQNSQNYATPLEKVMV